MPPTFFIFIFLSIRIIYGLFKATNNVTLMQRLHSRRNVHLKWLTGVKSANVSFTVRSWGSDSFCCRCHWSSWYCFFNCLNYDGTCVCQLGGILAYIIHARHLGLGSAWEKMRGTSIQKEGDWILHGFEKKKTRCREERMRLCEVLIILYTPFSLSLFPFSFFILGGHMMWWSMFLLLNHSGNFKAPTFLLSACNLTTG